MGANPAPKIQDLYERYGGETKEQLGEQLSWLAEQGMYESVFDEADIDPRSISSWGEFRQIPFTKGEDLLNDIKSNPPFGTLHQQGSMISFTPFKDTMLPIYETPEDIETFEVIHETIFRRIGIEPGDRVIITMTYHGFGSGYLLHRAFENMGVEVIPSGPGESEQTAQTIDEYDVDIVFGNPSFGLKIAQHGGDAAEIFIGAGEPFTSIPGQRERVRNAFENVDTVVDYFGTRQAWPAACECSDEVGLHVLNDFIIAEIIDPDTGDVLPLGERGEVVLTHINKRAGPLLRYRTGDLSVLNEASSSLGESTVAMPRGVFGRTDERHKVKGVKLYPQGVALTLAGFPELTGNHQIRISRPESTDKLTVVCEGSADEDDLTEALTRQLQIKPDNVEFTNDLGEDAEAVVDDRY